MTETEYNDYYRTFGTIQRPEPTEDGFNEADAVQKIVDRIPANRTTGKLAPDQAQVLLYAALGIPNQEIAKRLDIAVGTVATRLWRIYRCINVVNRAQAAWVVCSVLLQAPRSGQLR